MPDRRKKKAATIKTKVVTINVPLEWWLEVKRQAADQTLPEFIVMTMARPMGCAEAPYILEWLAEREEKRETKRQNFTRRMRSK